MKKEINKKIFIVPGEQILEFFILLTAAFSK